MIKADIKLPIHFPIGSIIISIIISFINFNAVTVIIYLGSLYLLIYYLFGYIKRKDALIIDDSKMIVKSPFKSKIYHLNELKSIHIGEGSKQLKAILKIEDDIEITLCHAIYNQSIEEIYEFLIRNNPELKAQ